MTAPTTPAHTCPTDDNLYGVNHASEPCAACDLETVRGSLDIEDVLEDADAFMALDRLAARVAELEAENAVFRDWSMCPHCLERGADSAREINQIAVSVSSAEATPATPS